MDTDRAPHRSLRVFARLTAAVLAGLALTVPSGCKRPETLEYAPDGMLVEMLADEFKEDDPELHADLEEQIYKLLLEHCGTPKDPKMLGVDLEAMTREARFRYDEHLKHGAAVYNRRCSPCHGVTGDGNGPMAKYLVPKPRDYRGGRDPEENRLLQPSIFKFTTTPYGSKPRRSDLIMTLRRGVSGTSMPSFARLSDADIEAVVDYVLVLTHRGELERALYDIAMEEEEIDGDYLNETIEEILDVWKVAEGQLVQPASKMPDFTPESVAQGKQIFTTRECNKCHGMDGRGGSFGLEVGKDAWGYKAAAADLTSGMFHGGGRPIDIYRRIYSGINGSPMPKFGESFADNPDAIWYLAHFVADIGEQRRLGNLPEDPAAGAPAGGESETDESEADNSEADNSEADNSEADNSESDNSEADESAADEFVEGEESTATSDAGDDESMADGTAADDTPEEDPSESSEGDFTSDADDAGEAGETNGSEDESGDAVPADDGDDASSQR